MEIAREKGLPELQHHILPRTKGFVLLMKGIHKHITGVYDITVAFQTPKNPELSNLLIGHRCQAEAFIRRIPVSEIPYDDEEKSAQFIHKLFQEKVMILFYKIFFISSLILFIRIKSSNILSNMEHLMVLEILAQI